MRVGVVLTLCLACALPTADVVGAEADRPELLAEGTVLDALDGRIVRAEEGEAWLFESVADVNRPDVHVRAGTRFELLPSPVLGQLIEDVNDRHLPRYRLSAQVTQYRGRNYLLPVYFLPLSKLRERLSGTPDGEPVEDRPVARLSGPANPELAVPTEILERLKNRPPLRAARGRHADRTDSQRVPARSRMLVDRVGMIRPEGDGFVFVPYALGWDVSDERFRLLPCRTLEQALARQRALVDPIRLNVAGLVTEFDGRRHLLLQRTAPVYNYGNFAR